MSRVPKKTELVGSIYAERFRVDAYIDSGIMGSVYRATQLDKDRVVALKVVNAELVEEDEIVKRFHREMKATAAIKHPNTVRVYQYGHTPEGELYLAMELLEGRSLDEVIADEAPMPPERVALLAAQIASALTAANDQGIVHRDLKAENIMVIERPLKPSLIKVLDFGLARVSDPDASGAGEQLTAYGSRVGTPSYMAPEYVTTFEVDHRGDLYALGVLMYEMTCGKPPFRGAPYEVMSHHVKTPPPPLASQMKAPPPEWLNLLIERLLAKKPEDRPQSGREVVDILARNVEIPELDAPLPRAGAASGKVTAGPKSAVWVGGAALLVALLGLGGGAVVVLLALSWGG